MVGGAVSASVASTVEFDKGTNANVFAEVDVAGNSSYNGDLIIIPQA